VCAATFWAIRKSGGSAGPKPYRDALLLRHTRQSAFPSLHERSQRGPAAFCAPKDALRDALANLVVFSERSVFANPLQRKTHVGKRPSIEASFNHDNPRTWVIETPATWISPASRRCLYKTKQAVWFPCSPGAGGNPNW
jgi:hypothetical protein